MVEESTQNDERQTFVKVSVESEDQIPELLQKLSDHPVLLVPQGLGSRKLLPAASQKQIVLLDMQRLTEPFGLAAADFYVECRAGLPLAELHRRLETAELKFPFLTGDCPGTVGGLVASGQLKSEQGCFNISRWVLAVTAFLADGRRVSSGAVTFKSVAGYDLPKLFCGSFGTLGIITRVALRCYPKTGQVFGKDLLPVPEKSPVLLEDQAGHEPPAPAAAISKSIKESLDPTGLFPIIASWNRG